MLEHNRTKDILIGVMAIAMVVVSALVAKQLLNASTPPQNSPQSVGVSNENAATSSIRSFKSSAELEAFLKSNDPVAVVLRTYMASTSAASTSLLK